MKSVETSEPYFRAEAVTNLMIVLQEATRATPDGAQNVYVPPEGGQLAEARYHHFLFGQRGSGKSTLLRKLQRDQSEQHSVSVWIDQEIFSALAFPDVLVGSVESVMAGVLTTTRARIAAARKALRPWKRWLGKKDSDSEDLQSGLQAAVENLRILKFAPLLSTVEWVRVHNAKSSAEVAGTVTIKGVSAGGKSGGEHGSSVQATETIMSDKGEFLERALPDFRALLQRAAAKTEGGFIFLDDVYLLNREDQPRVLGYMHRLVKDTGFWLKIGSIRYLTSTYSSGSTPVGMQQGQDAHLIALDDGMRNLNSSRQFLERILRGLAAKANVDLDRVFNQGSLNRLALASGCVPRDYLTLATAAIGQARNRGLSEKAGMDRVTVEDVNKAAGVLAPEKLNDMEHDAPESAAESRLLINELTEFCRRTKCAYFLIDASDRDLVDNMEALRHLRFVHQLEQSETVPDRASRYDVWLLDVSQLSAQRATQGMDFEGWSEREKRRKRSLIFQRPTGRQDEQLRLMDD